MSNLIHSFILACVFNIFFLLPAEYLLQCVHPVDEIKQKSFACYSQDKSAVFTFLLIKVFVNEDLILETQIVCD